MEEISTIRNRRLPPHSDQLVSRTTKLDSAGDQSLLSEHGDHDSNEDISSIHSNDEVISTDYHGNRKIHHYDDTMLWSWYGIKLRYQQLLWPITIQLDSVWLVVMVIAFVSRFWRLDEPHRVIFDEVHFGKFASHYIRGTSFFDVHPPLGKLLFALIGALYGYEGDFSFETIGLEYPRTVPYVAMRSLSALCGFLLIPCVYQIMIELGFKSTTATVAALMVILDNGLVIQSRVIMLDSLIILFTALSLLSFLKFAHLGRRYAWSYSWFFWLLSTGLSIGVLLGTKYTGLLGTALVGFLTIADLWQLLGNKLLPLIEVVLHLLVRLLAFLGVPFLMNLFFFFIHFYLLSGITSHAHTVINNDPQAQLASHPNATMMRYGSTFLLHNKQHNCWLHSHGYQYPLKYPDDRGSSYQQQVTCYEYQDENNYWTIRKPASSNDVELGSYRGPVHNKDVVEIIHIGTQKLLNSHDVAGPMTPQNQEVAGYINHSAKFVPYLHWRVEVADSSGDYPIYWSDIDKALVKFVHVQSGQALAATGERLPDWAFNQIEVTTSRATEGDHARWQLGDLKTPDLSNLTENDISDGRALKPAPPPPVMEEEPIGLLRTVMSFFERYADLQARMFDAHSSLSDHTFSSRPMEWVWLTKTLPYWLDDHSNAQVTLVGNPILWWMGNIVMIMYPILVACYLIRRRRLIFDLPQGEWQQWWVGSTILLSGWLLHVTPYMLVSRVLFLHHYLPAVPFLAMFLSAMLEHLSGVYTPKRVSQLVHVAMVMIVLYGFSVFFPFSYGYPALSNDQVLSRQWQPMWHLLYHKTI